MKRYRITLTHDAGRVRITTNASTICDAIRLVLNAERAPESAIVKVEVLK